MPKYELSRDGINQLALHNSVVRQGLEYHRRGEVTYEDALIMIIMNLVKVNETLVREMVEQSFTSAIPPMVAAEANRGTIRGMNTRELYEPAIEAAKQRWPITDRTKITVLRPRYLGEAPPIQGFPGVGTTVEIEGVKLTPEWAGNYFEGWDELIIGRIRNREEWETAEGEPDWVWDQ